MTTIRTSVTAVLALALVASASPAMGTGRSSGDLLWASHARKGRSDSATGVVVSPDGATVFVTGDHDASLTETDWATLAYNASDGTVLWGVRRAVGDVAGTQDIAVAPDGARVYVVGTQRFSGDSDWATAAYDARTGATLWYTVRSKNSIEVTRTVVASPDGSTVFVSGEEGVEGYVDTVAYSAETGSELWAQTYDGPLYDEVFDSAITPNGSTLLVTGTSYYEGEYFDYATVAYDARSGSELWVARYSGTAHFFDETSTVGVSPDSSTVYVSGYTDSTTGYHFGTFALDASTGSVLWYAESDGRDDEAVGLAVSPDGSYVAVTGPSEDGTTGIYDYLTIAYDATTGAELWRRRFDIPAHLDDYPVAIGASPDGRKVFVTGYSYGPTGKTNFITIAYNAATGRTMWLRTYDGPRQGGRDEPAGIAVSPTGSGVFVAGTSVGLGGDFDIATVAYQP